MMATEVKKDDLPQLYDPLKCAYNCSSHHQIVAKHGQSTQFRTRSYYYSDAVQKIATLQFRLEKYKRQFK